MPPQPSSSFPNNRVLLFVAFIVSVLSAGASARVSAAEATAASGPVVGVSGPGDLVLAEGGRTAAVIVVRESAGEWEKRAADDLALYIGKLAGTAPRVAISSADVAAALAGKGPTLVVGQAALDAEPSLKSVLKKAADAAKPAPLLRLDTVAIRRAGHRVYLAGSNDESHYYAVVELLRRWGCRWYMPGEFGECVPRHGRLAVGQLDYAYASPFEVRRYWLSWNGDTTGQQIGRAHV